SARRTGGRGTHRGVPNPTLRFRVGRAGGSRPPSGRAWNPCVIPRWQLTWLLAVAILQRKTGRSPDVRGPGLTTIYSTKRAERKSSPANASGDDRGPASHGQARVSCE